jgi:nitroreductase
MDVYEAIRSKRAIRHYLEKPIPEEDVHTILNAGRLSQSAKNLQPWHFVALQKRERLQQLAEAGQFSAHLGQAALGVVILTPDPAERFQILFDAGQTAAYMQLAAWELGIGSCLVTSYNREGVSQLLGLPDDAHVRVAIAFGYPHPDRPRFSGSRQGRRPFEDVVHWETW